MSIDIAYSLGESAYGPFSILADRAEVWYIEERTRGGSGDPERDEPCLVSCDQSEFDLPKAESTWSFTI